MKSTTTKSAMKEISNMILWMIWQNLLIMMIILVMKRLLTKRKYILKKLIEKNTIKSIITLKNITKNQLFNIMKKLLEKYNTKSMLKSITNPLQIITKLISMSITNQLLSITKLKP